MIIKLSDKVKTNSDNLELMGEVVEHSIRVNDYFGKIGDDRYVVIATNTSLGGAVVLAEKISHKLLADGETQEYRDYYFGVTQAAEIDSINDILEKLDDALSRSLENSSHRIEIEA